jgi:cation diffusion facilitator CzcD-associated flavoprotein CzcO
MSIEQTWTWTERFPGHEELRKYFEHVTKVLDLKKDIEFKAEVIGAEWDNKDQRWLVKTRDGRVARCKYFVNCVGTSFKRLVPDFQGLKDYQGQMCHSSFWPKEGVDVKGKSVAVIGTGATGLQIIQDWSKQAEKLTIFLRTP